MNEAAAGRTARNRHPARRLADELFDKPADPTQPLCREVTQLTADPAALRGQAEAYVKRFLETGQIDPAPSSLLQADLERIKARCHPAP